MQIQVLSGDITKVKVDAIVNAANQYLRGGSGVDGAIHQAGGPSILEECKKIGHCAIGDAVVTGGGRLSAHYVIHTVGPIWQEGRMGEEKLLLSCYQKSFQAAANLGCTSIAFPAISTGVFGYPKQNAVQVVQKFLLDVFSQEKVSITEIIFILFDQENFSLYRSVLSKYFN